MKHYDTIVIGCGGIGSATCYWLSRSGKSVLGIEQFQLGHLSGGSQDHSRIIRLAQHQQAYSALAPHAYETWFEVEQQSGVQIVLKTGGLVIEDAEGRKADKVGDRNIGGYVKAFEKQGIDFELLTAQALMRRWPQFHLRGHEQAIYQKDSGIVNAQRANAVHVALARANGVDFLTETPVTTLTPVGTQVEVVTPQQRFLADHVIVTSGAWTNKVLQATGISLPLTITQEQVTYYATPNLRDFVPEVFPVFMWHGAHNFYGFPIYGEVATKLGQHMGGHEVTAETRSFTPDPVRQARQRTFLSRTIPGFLGPELYSKTCLYTVPPDQHFVLDTLPEAPQISVAIGAGHAYKFASLLGKILSELALEGGSRYPIDTFNISRLAITDPEFPKAFHA